MVAIALGGTLLYRQCLPEIATGAKRPRNDKSENLAPLNLCHDHCRSAWRSLSAATDAIGRCVFIDTFFRIHSFPCPAPTANAPARRKKSSDLSIGASCWRYLSFRAVTRKVLSAQMSLTSVFGMGTGVPSPQSTPTIYLSSGFCPRTFIIIPPLDSLVKRFFGDPSGIRTHVNGVRGRCLNHLTMGPWCTFTDSNRGPTD